MSESKARGRPKKETTTETPVPAQTQQAQKTQQKPGGVYFVYFIRQVDGVRLENAKFLVGSTNNVPDFRKLLEANFPSGLKTHAVIKCNNGDAEAVASAFANSHTSVLIKNGWYGCGKGAVEAFIAEKCKNSAYEAITEGKAKHKS